MSTPPQAQPHERRCTEEDVAAAQAEVGAGQDEASEGEVGQAGGARKRVNASATTEQVNCRLAFTVVIVAVLDTAQARRNAYVVMSSSYKTSKNKSTFTTRI